MRFRPEPEYIRTLGLILGQVAGMLAVWFGNLDYDYDPPRLMLWGWRLLAIMAAAIAIGAALGWYIAHRIARRWLD